MFKLTLKSRLLKIKVNLTLVQQQKTHYLRSIRGGYDSFCQQKWPLYNKCTFYAFLPLNLKLCNLNFYSYQKYFIPNNRFVQITECFNTEQIKNILKFTLENCFVL
jgi:hypothetical protein